MIKKILYAFLTLSLIGCYSVPKHLISDYGTYSHKDNSKLRIDGYYYQIDSIKLNGEKHKPKIRWIVLYENGALLQSFQMTSDFIGFDRLEYDIFINPTAGYNYNENSEKKDTWWGVYSINDSLINFQYFQFFNNWTAIERKGVILNDTTIQMKSSKTLNGYHKEKESIDYGLYRFKRFDNKPDSTNWMMSDKYYQNKIKTLQKSDVE